MQYSEGISIVLVMINIVGVVAHEVGGDFLAVVNRLETLEYGPSFVGGHAL
jgi:hypothetical protein